MGDRRVTSERLLELLTKNSAAPPMERLGFRIALYRLIASGSLPPGAIMPSERSLVDTLQTTRALVRVVFQDLANSGFLASRQGSGWEICLPSVQPGSFLIITWAPIAIHAWQPEIGSEADLADAARQVFQANHRRMSVMTPVEIEHLGIQRLLALRPAAVLVLDGPADGGTPCGDALISLQARGTPIISSIACHGWKPDHLARHDHTSGCGKLVEHMVRSGCSRIQRLWVGSMDGLHPSFLQQRDVGYEQASRRLDVQMLPALTLPFRTVYRPEERETAERIILGFLHEPLCKQSIDGLLLPTDSYATPVMNVIRYLGVTRPITIAGYDSAFFAGCWRDQHDVRPHLSIDKRNQMIGRHMAEIALAIADGNRIPHIDLSPVLKIGTDIDWHRRR
jgi:DNA-binding LacI/PurR family transcriptional regulator